MSGQNASNASKAIIFALLTTEIGSYTFGDVRIPALEVTPIPKETADLIDEDNSPVKLFKDKEAADKVLAGMKAKIEARTNPKPQS